MSDLNSELELNKSVNIFDMKKFQANVNRELKLTYPNRRKLENQCICAIVFVKDTSNLLEASSWILLINIVALDLLKSRLPATMYGGNFSSPEIKMLPRFNSNGYNSRFIASDEDPYSILMPSTNSTSTASSEESKKLHTPSNSSSNTSSRESIVDNHKPPELPPRDFTKSKKANKNRFGLRSLVKSNSNGKLNQLSHEMDKNYGE